MTMLHAVNPVTGRRGDHGLKRWAEVDGVVLEIERLAGLRGGIYAIGIDIDTLWWLADGAPLYGQRKSAVTEAITALSMDCSSGASIYGRSCKIALRLYGRGRTHGWESVPEAIERLVDSDDWALIRDAWAEVLLDINASKVA